MNIQFCIRNIYLRIFVMLATGIFCLSGCAATPKLCPAISQPDPATAILSAQPGAYDYSSLQRGVFNVAGPYQGCTLSAAEQLEALNRSFAAILVQIPVDAHPIAGSVRIVLPDHVRLRVLAEFLRPALGNGAAANSAVELTAENFRLQQHAFADAVVRSKLFSSATLVEQNDTAYPDEAGANYLIWFQVLSASGNADGPWTGSWLFKRAKDARNLPIGAENGLPIGLPQYVSFIKSIRLATGNQ